MFGKTNIKKVNTLARLAWIKSPYAKHYFQNQTRHLQSALMQFSGPSVLQIGKVLSPEIESQLDFPLPILTRAVSYEIIKKDRLESNVAHDENLNVMQSDAAFLPLADESISSLIMPHVLETHTLPHQVLREAHRVLKPEGCLVLTSFNPRSFVSLQRFLSPDSAYKGQYYSAKRVKDWLQLLGFEVTGGAMYQYAPLTNSPRLRKLTAFLELAGNRWFPMFGGAYMIVAKKRDLGGTLVGNARVKKKPVRLRHIAAKVSQN